METQPKIDIKYIENLRELAKPVAKTAEVIAALCNADTYDCQLSPVIEHFTKQLADYLDGIYEVDEMTRCLDWYDENILPSCRKILLSDRPVTEMVQEKYENALNERITQNMRMAIS